MIRMIKFFFFCLITIFPLFALAQGTVPIQPLGPGNSSSLTFTPAPTDLSVSFLGQIFGTVGTVLHGTSGQMLGQLFKIFNLGLLAVAGLFLIYTIVMTVLNTAHEGEFMGRKWSSGWIALRVIIGLGLLVPSATTGYSIIQVIVMWVVVQSVGFANMAWQSALTYIAEGGQVYTPPATDTSSMVNAAGSILQMQTCMYTNQNIYLQQKKAEQEALKQQQAQAGPPSNTTNTATPTPPGVNNVQRWTPLFTTVEDPPGIYRSVVKFPGNPYSSGGQQDAACGQISFGTDKDLGTLLSDQKATTLKAAVNQMMIDLDSYAQEISKPPKQKNSSNNNPNFTNQLQSAVIGAAADWVNTTLPIRSGATSQEMPANLLEKYVAEAAAQGWVMAGRYYYALGNIRHKISAATSVSVNMDYYPAGFWVSWTSAASNAQTQPYIDFSGAQSDPTPAVNNMDGLRLSDADKKILLNNLLNVSNFVHPAVALAQKVDQSQSKLPAPSGGANAGILSFMFNSAVASITKDTLEMSKATGDPILVLQAFGHQLIGGGIAAWLLSTVGVFSLGAATSLFSEWNSLGYALTDALLIFVPLYTIFILSLVTIGGVLSYYVPLIPYIIFTFSVVGWLIAVIEAMVAAPLVALGVTHPEGHDFLGKSEQAIMLLLSVFVRPVLMVLGLVAAIIFSRVVLRFLNTGFFQILVESVGGGWTFFGFVPIFFIYTSLVVTIVNQSFSLIYMIPDRVMRWLGVSEQTTTAGEALQAAKQGYEQVAGGIEKMQGGAIQSMGESTSRKVAEVQKGKKTTATGE